MILLSSENESLLWSWMTKNIICWKFRHPTGMNIEHWSKQDSKLFNTLSNIHKKPLTISDIWKIFLPGMDIGVGGRWRWTLLIPIHFFSFHVNSNVNSLGANVCEMIEAQKRSSPLCVCCLVCFKTFCPAFCVPSDLISLNIIIFCFSYYYARFHLVQSIFYDESEIFSIIKCCTLQWEKLCLSRESIS